MQSVLDPQTIFHLDEYNEISLRPFYYAWLLDTNHLGDRFIDQNTWDEICEPVLQAIATRSLGRHWRSFDHHWLTIIDQIREKQRRLAKTCLFDETYRVFLEVHPSDFSLTPVNHPKELKAQSNGKEKEELTKLLDDPVSLKAGFSADFPVSLQTWLKRREIVLRVLKDHERGKVMFPVTDVSLAMAIWDLQEMSGATPMAELTDLVRQVVRKYADKTQHNLDVLTYRIPGQSDAQWALRRLDSFLNLRGLENWCAEAKSHLDWDDLFIGSGDQTAILVPPSQTDRKEG